MKRLAFLALGLWLAAVPVHAARPGVAAGGWHSLALHADGSVRSWGDDSAGALGLGRALFSATPLPVPHLANVVAVAAGGNHTVALKSDGTVWAWGANDNGELGDGSTTSRSSPVRVAGLEGVAQIAAGRFFTVARKSDGTVWTWGSNYAGELGAEGGHRSLAAPVSGLAGIVEVAAGPYHAVARRSDGTVWSWGLNGDGQLGDGTRLASYEGRSTPVQVAGLRDVVQVAAGGWHTLARRNDGTVWAWGSNAEGQSGDGSAVSPRLTPVQVQLANVVDIAAGMYHSLARGANGSVWAWGSGGYGQIGDGRYEDRRSPVQLVELAEITQMAAGFLHSVAVTGEGMLFVWGSNSNGQLGDGSSSTRTRPALLPLTGIAAAAVGLYHTIALRRDGTVLTWGDDAQGQLGSAVFTFRATPQNVAALPSITQVSAGYLHSLALAADGRVFAWGSNALNQLAIDGIGRSSAAPIAGIANATQISAGTYHSVVRLADGTLRTIGSNYRGRLGNGDGNDFGPISTVRNLAGVRQASAGGGHTLAVKGDGSVWAWGENDYGQLGDGSTTDRYAPVQVLGLGDVVEVAAGISHSLARKSDGSVWAWGRNIEGQLGDGSQSSRPAPVRVSGLPSASAIAAGREFSFALVEGDVWAWGINYSGGLGCTGCDASLRPMKVRGLERIAAVSAFHHVLALREDGSVLAWGGNNVGQVGDGTLVDREVPAVVLHEGGTGSVAGNDWFLDLEPAVATSIPADKVPVFLVAAASAGADITANLRYRPQDVGSSASVFVFALAPADMVKGAVEDPALPLKLTAKRAGKTSPPLPCVLAQLNAAGQLVGVSVANLQAYITGVLSAQGQAISILNGVPTANIGGATFFVGYGTTPSSMVSGGTNRGVVTIPGAAQCRPEPPQTGWWWNPLEDGRGYSIEKRGNNVFFAAFLYDVSGRSTWHVATGPMSLDGSLFVGDLLAARGGQSLGGAYPGFPTLSTVGPISLAFNTATTGTMVWPGGTVPIQRFDIIANGRTLGSAANMPESGWWWNEQEPGRGFFLEWQGTTLDIAGYMYDDAGNPVWYLTVGNQGADGRSFSGTWWSYGNGMTLAGPWRPHMRTNANVAPVTITFSGADSALMTLPNGRTTALRRHRF